MSAHQMCTFRVAELFCGVAVDRVQEVVRHQRMTPVPLAPWAVRGLINLRGQIVAAIDLRRCLNLAERPAEQLPSNVVLRTADGGASLLVDEVGEILDVDEGSFEDRPATLQGPAGELIGGAYKLPDRLLLRLDTDRLLEAVFIHPERAATQERS
jgi:purine-binding chemotaxis protein CheW